MLNDELSDVADRARELLEERSTGDDITVQTLEWGGGDFAVVAFHTVSCGPDVDHIIRETVEYDTFSPETSTLESDSYVFGVRHYPAKNVQRWNRYTLEEIESC